jgi:ABC-type anion transport system duplicated permease subunit
MSQDLMTFIIQVVNIPIVVSSISQYVRSDIFSRRDKIMNRNLSTSDRVVRLILAALFAYLYFGGIVGGTPGVALVTFGGIFLLTSAAAFCPLHTPFKFSTDRK